MLSFETICKYVVFVSLPAALMLIAIVTKTLAGSMNAGVNDTDVIKVRAADIPSRVQIIGELGYPLCTLVAVHGIWEKPEAGAKDSRLHLRVTRVDGNDLHRVVRFPIELVKSAPGMGQQKSGQRFQEPIRERSAGVSAPFHCAAEGASRAGKHWFQGVEHARQAFT